MFQSATSGISQMVRVWIVLCGCALALAIALPVISTHDTRSLLAASATQDGEAAPEPCDENSMKEVFSFTGNLPHQQTETNASSSARCFYSSNTAIHQLYHHELSSPPPKPV